MDREGGWKSDGHRPRQSRHACGAAVRRRSRHSASLPCPWLTAWSNCLARCHPRTHRPRVDEEVTGLTVHLPPEGRPLRRISLPRRSPEPPFPILKFARPSADVETPDSFLFRAASADRGQATLAQTSSRGGANDSTTSYIPG